MGLKQDVFDIYTSSKFIKFSPYHAWSIIETKTCPISKCLTHNLNFLCFNIVKIWMNGMASICTANW